MTPEPAHALTENVTRDAVRYPTRPNTVWSL